MVGAVIAGLAVAAGLVAATGISLVVGYVLGFGLITFSIYGYDKWRAIRAGRRVPELALLLLTLLGGAAGGWAGMLVWRHKINHASFWIAQVVGTVAILAVLLQV